MYLKKRKIIIRTDVIMEEINCKELKELLERLKPKNIIYTSREGNNYHFIEFINGKLYFDIPNHIDPKHPNIKSIKKEQFCKLLKELKNKKYLIISDFPFRDCRIGAFYGFISILYPNTYSKTKGKISLIKTK